MLLNYKQIYKEEKRKGTKEKEKEKKVLLWGARVEKEGKEKKKVDGKYKGITEKSRK